MSPMGKFSYFELTEVMQQQGDSIFIYIFDNNKVGVIWEIDIALTSSKACTINNRSLSVEAI